MSTLNILAVGTLPPHQGGSAVSSWQMLLALKRAGHRIRSISAMTPPTAEACREFDASLGIENHRYQLATYPNDLSTALDDAVAAERRQVPELMDFCIARERPDAILVGRDNLAPSVAPRARRYEIPWVLRTTGYILRTIEDGCHGKDVADSILSAAQEAATIAVQGPHLLPLARNLGYRRMVIIPNSVDEREFTPQPRSERMCRRLNVGFDARIVVHASNLKPVKRAMDLIDSAPAVLSRYPNAIYVIAGDGPCRAGLEQRCRDLGISRSFRFAGWLPYQEMPELLSLADVVVMPSGFEQQAGVYLETQACGRTLLASDIPSAREVVEDGRTGLLFRSTDAEDLARQTLLALADPELREEIGMRAAAEVLKKHSLGRVARQFETVLRSAVQSRNGARVHEPSRALKTGS